MDIISHYINVLLLYNFSTTVQYCYYEAHTHTLRANLKCPTKGLRLFSCIKEQLAGWHPQLIHVWEDMEQIDYELFILLFFLQIMFILVVLNYNWTRFCNAK